MVEQIDDYFSRQRLCALISDQLEKRIDGLEMKVLLAEKRSEFAEFYQSFQSVQKDVEAEIKLTITHVLNEQ